VETIVSHDRATPVDGNQKLVLCPVRVLASQLLARNLKNQEIPFHLKRNVAGNLSE
jgi:hypothetical protein